MAENTVTGMIEEIRNQALKDMQVDEAALALNKLSSLLGNVNEEWVQAEMEYNRMYARAADTYEKITEARAHAKASDEYERKIRAEGVRSVVSELINSHKYLIKIKLQERREASYG
jgi:hypothetical protein